MPLAARLLIACGLLTAAAPVLPAQVLLAQVPELPAPAADGSAEGGAEGLAGGPGGEAAVAAPIGGDPWLLGLTPLEWAVQTAPFLIASLIALWFGVERLVVLRASRVIPEGFVNRFLNLIDSGRLSGREAQEMCEENGSPVAEVFRHAVKKAGRPAMEVEQAVIDGGARQVSHLRKHLRILNAVATVSPLMGLLGTVIGMIRAFARIADGAGAMGDADQLAAGIVTALLTTALGLTVAIPSLVLYFYLSGRVESLVMRMDELAERIVEAVAMEEEEHAAPSAEPPTGTHRPADRPIDRPNGRPVVKNVPTRDHARIPVRTDA